MKKRGSSLVSVLLVASLCTLLAFTVAGVSVSHLGVANRLENTQVARLNAEAAAHHLIGLICENPKLGTRQGPPGQSLAFEVALNGGLGRASFDATAYGFPASLNNLSSDKAAVGWKRTLPPHSLQIITQGLFRNEKRTLETILTIPPYKYALATTGEFRSDGGLQVLGVESLDDLAGGLNRIPKDKIKPGHLASNSQKTASDDAAIDLKADAGNPILITGDALAVGSLRCDPNFVTIEGAPRGGSEPAKIPKLDISSYDPALMQTGYQNLTSGDFATGMNVTSAVRLRGNLNVSGGLNLDDGFVYVDGNVNIQGGIHGKGMLVSTHNVTINGRAALSAADSVGLAAGGDVALNGSASNQSQMNNNTFRGVVYTEGDFSAHGIQLVGTVLGNKQGSQGSQMKLTNVNLIHNPGSVDVKWSNGWQPELGTSPYWSLPADWAPAARRDDYTIDKVIFNHHSVSLGNLAYTPEQMEALEAAGLLPAALQPDKGRKVFPSDKNLIQQATFYPPGLGPQTDGRGGDLLGLVAGSDLTSDPILRDTPWFQLVKQQVARELQLESGNTLWWTQRIDGQAQRTTGLSANGPLQFVWALHTKSGRLFNSPCDYVTYVYRTNPPDPGHAGWGTDRQHDRERDEYIEMALAKVAEYDRNYRDYLLDLAKTKGVLDGNVSLDPNQFVQLQDKMKRVLVREVTL